MHAAGRNCAACNKVHGVALFMMRVRSTVARLSHRITYGRESRTRVQTWLIWARPLQVSDLIVASPGVVLSL